MSLKWKYSIDHKMICKVLDEREIWGNRVCRVWLPEKSSVINISTERLTNLDDLEIDTEAARIGYLSGATKIFNMLNGHGNENSLLSPSESNVIPLPHQLKALKKATSSQKVRFLLADEVGLGKTIEAGLIMRELKIRGLVKRVLVVSPKSLAMQWVAEMRNHFNEDFSIIEPLDLEVFSRLKTPILVQDQSYSDYNPWLDFDQVIVTLDSVKPLRNRRNWSEKKIFDYNKNRFANLIAGNWDLIIVDEAHKLGGSNDRVARHELGKALSESAPYLLLLSATPHQGKSDAFQRLMSLIDPMVFPDVVSVTKENVQRYVIRTEKRKAVNDKGEALFQPRITNTIKVNLLSHPLEFKLYEAVSNYVKKGYNIALKDKKPHIGFLMVLLQRIATSSTYAIKASLEKRALVLENLHEQVDAFNEDLIELFPEMTGQEMVDELLEINEKGRIEELEQVQNLLDIAKQVERQGSDKKALVLFEEIYRIQTQEQKQVKVLIFTEFIATQEMLKAFLEERGIKCTVLNGTMNMQERLVSQHEFRDNARVLISTDAGGEGLNLQFCHVVMNYDLPWNPMRIEQRIGRVDRIGQQNVVKAVNFVYAGSVEERVREVLESKLEIIFHDLGIDKKSDILESSISGELLEKLMTKAIMEETDFEDETEAVVTEIKKNHLKFEEEQKVYTVSEEFDLLETEKIKKSPLPFWIEKMTLNYLTMKDIETVKSKYGLSWEWPDGLKVTDVVFHGNLNSMNSNFISFSDAHIRGLIDNIPFFAEGQPVPVCEISDLPPEIQGVWGIFEVSLESLMFSKENRDIDDFIRKRYFPIFLSDENQVFLPTAMYIWDLLQSQIPSVKSRMNEDQSRNIYKQLLDIAEKNGKQYYEMLLNDHKKHLSYEKERGKIYFNSKLRTIDRLGLEEVKEYRLKKYKQEKEEWENSINLLKDVVPDIKPIYLLKVND